MPEPKDSVKILTITVLLLLALGIYRDTPASAASTAVTLRESNDFATVVLRDPWDMSEFSDVSQGLNQAGASSLYVQNVQLANGVFAAESTSVADAQFFPLWPGFQNSMKLGKVGARFPIPSATYHCIYFAMNVQSTSSDFAQVFWFGDDRQAAGVYGGTGAIPISPSIWKLYSVDLATASSVSALWTAQAQWQGLRIDPTTQANINFSVDWVRLTNCTAVTQTITWSSNPSVNSLWLTSSSTGNSILTKNPLNGSSGSFLLDTQGLAADTYAVCLSASSTSCTNTGTPNPSNITINQAPIATFNRPSPTSGLDYATQAGNPWDFVDSVDATQILNATYMFSNGILNLNTPSIAGGADPIIHLNTPQQISSGSLYRYLTFRLNTQGNWQDIGGGMIVRWIWTLTGNCELVSNQIPLDVGWQIYTADLIDSFNGSVIQTGGSCPPPPYSWSSSSPISRLRIDPNENQTGSNMIQQLDWIRLTPVDRVTHGTPYQIQISLNKPPQGVSFNYYYTDNPSNPTQHIAAQYSFPMPPPSPYHLFLPMILNSTTSSSGDLPPVTNGVTFTWDTSLVTAGQYYVCVVANDGLNQGTYCSEAPFQVN